MFSPRLKKSLLLAALTTSVAPAVADDTDPFTAAERQGLVIGSITLDKHNVFDLDNPEENNVLYRFANRVHVLTRDRTIRKQFLFREGEPLLARELQETERILRRNGYFFDAKIRIDSVEDDRANLEVYTRDVWTLNPDISLSRSGGENRTKFGIEETNLLGHGQTVRLARTENVDRVSSSVEFFDRQLGRSWVRTALRLSDNSDGRSNQLTLVRPFIELDARWSAGLEAIDDQRRIALYSLGEEAAEFERVQRAITLQRGWSKGLRNGWVGRWTAGVTYDDNRFGLVADPSLPAVIPEDRRLVYPFLGYELIENRFETSSNRDRMGRTEDFFLGTRLGLRVGYASPEFGADRDALIFDGSISKGFGSMDSKALLASASLSTRIESGQTENLLASMSLAYYKRQSQKRLFFASISASYGDDLDVDNPVQLGGDSGLRGYPLRYQNGDGKALLTLEQRYYTDWYPFRLFRVGGAVFFDAGRSFGDSPLGDSSDGWLKNAGFGLRLVPTRGGTNKIVHIDLAFPLDGDDSIDDVQFLIEAKSSF